MKLNSELFCGRIPLPIHKPPLQDQILDFLGHTRQGLSVD